MVHTNESGNSRRKIKISGFVERFADITPEKVKLEGEVGKQISESVMIIPRKDHPFKITNIFARKGDNIQYDLKNEMKDGEVQYMLTVKNTSEKPGRYADIIYLDTDSVTKSRLFVRVYGRIMKDDESRTN